ncbi:MAG: tRNA 2-thiouridine(34) synthase MnmA [bacterium]|nr:tRNA 2-thiouridine(34) synthase MnmA [bacterium]
MARIWNKHKQTPFDYAQGKNTPLKRKVFVAMSGGIDSSVAAALLKREGFDIVGVFMKFWSEPEEDKQKCGWNRCCSPDSEKRARQVAKILKIPFYVFNFEKEFKKRIVDYFLREYKGGRTPNPCVACNKEIKFGLLLEKALSLGTDFIATGHYTRLRREIRSSKSEILKLYMGKDKEKDQSYFLWQLSQEQLKHILFPVGDYTKSQVKALAKKFKLPFKAVPESMEVCFIQTTMIDEAPPHLSPRPAQLARQGSVNEFLKRHLKTKPGLIAEQTQGGDKKIIGRHQGLWFYTMGQRKGIGLSGGPYFVLGKDEKKNLLVVTKNEKDLLGRDLVLKNVNWISGSEPEFPFKVQIKIRYRGKISRAVIDKPFEGKIYTVKLETPQRAITPGQSAVFYRKQELVGGGIIC